MPLWSLYIIESCNQPVFVQNNRQRSLVKSYDRSQLQVFCLSVSPHHPLSINKTTTPSFLSSPENMAVTLYHCLLFSGEFYSKWDVAYIISTSCMVATLLRTVMLRHLLLLSAYTPYFVFQRTMVQIYKLFLMYQIIFHFFLL